MVPPSTTLAERLRHVLALRGTKAATLSRLAGLAQGHIGLILRGDVGHGVTADTLRKIADAAGVDYGWLATGEGSPEPADQTVPAPPREITLEPVREGPGIEPLVAADEAWPSILGAARRLAPDIAPWVWDTLGRSRLWLDQPMTPALAVSLARVIEAHVPPPHKRKP